MNSQPADQNPQPLASMDEWEDFLKVRYPAPAPASAVGASRKIPTVGTDPAKQKEEFRVYEADARPSVREFYRLNHTHQTHEFALAKRREFLRRDRLHLGVWEAIEYLNQLVDDSDPDTDLSQLQHLLQTAEAMRRDGQPRWMILTGLIHDLGKILCLWGEPQWAVVGDTFATGCAFSDKNVFPQFFAANPDMHVARYQTPNGIYEPGCGLEHVVLSWGHDEYIYHVARDHLPEEGLYMLRYHSFYPWHREGAYAQFGDEKDRAMLPWVLKFNTYDLYTKSHAAPDAAQLKPYYLELIREFFPEKIRW